MKKFLSLLLCIIFGLSLAGCSDSKEFKKEGVTITLNSSWREVETPYAKVFYQTSKAAFMVNKENPSDFVGYTFFKDKEHPSKYGDLVLTANNAKLDGKSVSSTDEKTNNGDYFAYASYDNVVNGIACRYLLVVMYGKEDLYCMNFYCAKSDFESSYDTFLSYAKTIVVE